MHLNRKCKFFLKDLLLIQEFFFAHTESLIIDVIFFRMSSILKSFGVKTALTPLDYNFFSSFGGIIPPTITGM